MDDAQLRKAIQVASRAFHGRVDRQGEPYIAHAVRVMLDVEPGDERIVALLHDVFEWGTITWREFKAAAFSQPIVDAIDAMTKREGESLEEHIDRVRASPLATAVKVADLRDNADPERLAPLPVAVRDQLVAMYRDSARLLGTTLEDVLARKVDLAG